MEYQERKRGGIERIVSLSCKYILDVTQVFGMLAKTTFGPKGYFKAIVMGEKTNTIITKNGGIISINLLQLGLVN